MPASSAQRSSSSADERRPQKAASATANDFASARPPKYCFTSVTPSGRSGKSDTSWVAAAASDRRSWPDRLDQRHRGVLVDPAARGADLGGHEPRELRRLQLG